MSTAETADEHVPPRLRPLRWRPPPAKAFAGFAINTSAAGSRRLLNNAGLRVLNPGLTAELFATQKTVPAVLGQGAALGRRNAAETRMK